MYHEWKSNVSMPFHWLNASSISRLQYIQQYFQKIIICTQGTAIFDSTLAYLLVFLLAALNYWVEDVGKTILFYVKHKATEIKILINTIIIYK